MILGLPEVIRQAWIRGDLPEGVLFAIHQSVRVISGNLRGTIGEVVELLSITREPYYLMKSEDHEISIYESSLEAVDKSVGEKFVYTPDEAEERLRLQLQLEYEELYQAGLALEQQGAKEKALECFKNIYARCYGYKDVAERVESSYE